jgi:hypothetical protein
MSFIVLYPLRRIWNEFHNCPGSSSIVYYNILLRIAQLVMTFNVNSMQLRHPAWTRIAKGPVLRYGSQLYGIALIGYIELT